GTGAVPRVPRCGEPVLLRGGDRAALLPGQSCGSAGAFGRWRGVLRADPDRCVGVGHLPLGPVRAFGACGDLQGRERRGAVQTGPGAAGLTSAYPGQNASGTGGTLLG